MDTFSIQAISWFKQLTTIVVDNLNLTISLVAIAIIAISFVMILKIIRQYSPRKGAPKTVSHENSVARRELEGIRNDVKQLTENDNTISAQVLVIGEAAIAAVSEIKSYLDKLSDRDRELEQRADSTDRSWREAFAVLEKRAQESADVAARLEAVRNQQAVASARFVELQKKIEADMTQQNTGYVENLRAVEESLASVHQRIETLSTAINLQTLELDEVSSELRSRYS
jgi:chromosome segregation ATPase